MMRLMRIQMLEFCLTSSTINKSYEYTTQMADEDIDEEEVELRWNMTTMPQSQMQHSMCPIPSHCSILLNSAPRSPHVQRSRPTLQRICKAERGGARTASHDLGSSRDLGMVHLVFGMVIFPRLVKLVFWMVLVLHIV